MGDGDAVRNERDIDQNARGILDHEKRILSLEVWRSSRDKPMVMPAGYIALSAIAAMGLIVLVSWMLVHLIGM